MTSMTIRLYDEETGEKVPHRIPAEWEICDACRGDGGSSAYLGSFSPEQLWELGEGWCEDYMAGKFDRPCEDCFGAGKVLVPFLPDGADPKLVALVARWEDQERQWARWEAEDRAIRRMESGTW